MIGGFALLAYPAEYGNSGVMTFVVNHQDVVFQKDLGLSTARVAGAMTTFNPDQSWSRVVIQQPQESALGERKWSRALFAPQFTVSADEAVAVTKSRAMNMQKSRNLIDAPCQSQVFDTGW